MIIDVCPVVKSHMYPAQDSDIMFILSGFESVLYSPQTQIL